MKNILKLAAAALLLILINSCDIESPYLEVIQSKMTRDFLPNFKIEGFVSSWDTITGEPSLGIKLSWDKPNSDTRIMINVNENSYPESTTDGIILTEDSVNKNEIIQEGETDNLVNRDFYYSIWILNDKDQPSGNPMHVSYRLNKETLSPEVVGQLDGTSGSGDVVPFNAYSDNTPDALQIGNTDSGSDYGLILKYNIFPHIHDIVETNIRMSCITAASESQSIRIFRITDSWEVGATYSTINGLSKELLNTEPYNAGKITSDIFWNVNGAVKAWCDEDIPNYGIKIEKDVSASADIPEYTNDPGNYPVLEVYYGTIPEEGKKEYTAELHPYLETGLTNGFTKGFYPVELMLDANDSADRFILRFNFPKDISLSSASVGLYYKSDTAPPDSVSFDITAANPWYITDTADSIYDLPYANKKTLTVNFNPKAYNSWDVTDIVSEWVNDPDSNYGLKFENYSSSTAISFDASERADLSEPNNPPKLTITYTR